MRRDGTAWRVACFSDWTDPGGRSAARRYARRWVVERTNAWLQNFRRLVVRYERSAAIFLGLIHMACALIALNRVSG